MQGHILAWAGWWHLRMDNNGPDDENDTCHLPWFSHCAKHFPLIILFSFMSTCILEGERNEVTE